MEDKYVGIITSASDEVNANYKSIAKDVSIWLANMDYNLVFGASSTSMMGECYNAFLNYGKKIYAVTTKHYQDDLKNLEYAKPLICETTFDMKKRIYENSDVIVMLPGGIGTFSEFFSFLDENRQREEKVPIEIYDEDGFYLPLIETLQLLVINKFADASILDSFKVSHDKEELFNHMSEYNKKPEYKGMRG